MTDAAETAQIRQAQGRPVAMAASCFLGTFSFAVWAKTRLGREVPA